MLKRTGSVQGIGTRLAYILARVQKKVNQGSGPRGNGMPGDSLGQLLLWVVYKAGDPVCSMPSVQGQVEHRVS